MPLPVEFATALRPITEKTVFLWTSTAFLSVSIFASKFRTR